MGITRCSSCNGTDFFNCKKYNLSGIVTCTTCDDASEVTQIAKICVTTTPKYTINYLENADDKIKQIIDKYITSNNADISNTTRAELMADEILGIVKAKRNALIMKVVLGVIGVLAVLGAAWYFF